MRRGLAWVLALAVVSLGLTAPTLLAPRGISAVGSVAGNAIVSTGSAAAWGTPNIAGTNITSGTVPTARLGSGTASASTCLLGNSTWGACGSGGGASTSMANTWTAVQTFTAPVTVKGGLNVFSAADNATVGTFDADTATELKLLLPGGTLNTPSFTFSPGNLAIGTEVVFTTGTGVAAGYINAGTVAPARLGSGTPSASTVLRGNSTWSALTASDITSGTFAPARLGTGTANATTYLRGDGTYATPGASPYLDTAKPATPASGVGIYSRNVGAHQGVSVVDQYGYDNSLQSSIVRNGVTLWTPNTTTTINTIGGPATHVGTVSTPALASTAPAFANALRRWRLVSAATANSIAESRLAQTAVWRGNAANLGGFWYVHRFSEASTTASQRLFVGLTNSTAATAATFDPSTALNVMGVGHASADTDLRMYFGDASARTIIPLGSLFPANTVAAVYELALFCPPGATFVNWTVTRLDTGDTVSGTQTANLVANTTFLAPHALMVNGGTAAAVTLDQSRLYLETND